MSFYRKKPIVVEASVYVPYTNMEDGIDYELNGELIDVNILEMMDNKPRSLNHELLRPYIFTSEGKLYISKGDYIVKGIEGERYPCKPSVFHKTYDEVVQRVECTLFNKTCDNCTSDGSCNYKSVNYYKR